MVAVYLAAFRTATTGRGFGTVLCLLLFCSTLSAQERPRQVAEELAKVYGHKLDQVAYIPALPLVAKLRLSELTGDGQYRDEVAKIVQPFLAGEKSPVPKSGSE